MTAYIIETAIAGEPRWLLKSGLCTRQKADAYRWPSEAAAIVAAKRHMGAHGWHVERVR